MLTNATWHNQPQQWHQTADTVTLTTEPKTDLWQRTHYGFSVDNAPMLLQDVGDRDFTFTVQTSFASNALYDQCGIVLYQDTDNWAKFSTEYETAEFQRLGGVVTKHGYSDWATSDIPSTHNIIHYRIRRTGNDFIAEYAYDGVNFRQLRIFNLNFEQPLTALKVGIYACSPQGAGFEAAFSRMTFTTH